MTLDVTCQSCDATFEVELADLLEESQLECPSCEARATPAAVDGVTSALDELFTQLSTLRRKFELSFEVESDDLPPIYEREARRQASADDEADGEEERRSAGEEWDEEADEREEADDEEP
jgi:hypothetical protein